MMRKAYKDRMLPEAFKKQMEKKKGLKKGQKRKDPKGNPAGYYDGDKKKKADMGRKGPYADGMGKKCTCDSVAEELRGLLINDDEEERADKPCGNSYIPQSATCRKGAGQPAKKAGANSPEKSGGESVNAKGGYAKFLKKKGIDPSKLGANSPKAEKLAQEYYKTAEGKAEFKKPELSDKQKRKAIRKVAAERFKGVKTEKLKAALKANKGNKTLEGRTVQKAARRELFNRGAQTALQSAVLGYGPGLYLESRRNKKRS